MEIPQSAKAALWSYDISALDIHDDRKRIIANVLNYGTKDAVDWLRQTYTKDEITDVVAHPKSGEWSKRSLNLWALVYDVPVLLKERF